MSTFLFAVFNVGIFFGYVFLGLYVVPNSGAKLRRTRMGGGLFFLTCGLHHLDNVFHVLLQGDERVAHVLTENHMLIIDAIQVVAVWMFVTGLYVEMIQWGPWHAGSDHREHRTI